MRHSPWCFYYEQAALDAESGNSMLRLYSRNFASTCGLHLCTLVPFITSLCLVAVAACCLTLAVGAGGAADHMRSLFDYDAVR